jgi:hypothetical protein
LWMGSSDTAEHNRLAWAVLTWNSVNGGTQA